MTTTQQPSIFWTRWLLVVSAGVVVFGLLLVLAPALTRQGFSLLAYASQDQIDSFGTEQVRYVSLAHAVIGGVMIGWGVALFYVTNALLASGNPVGWNIIAFSVAAWFLPDTAYSLIYGFWQNAVLNTVFLVLFAVPLWATRSAPR